MKMFNEKKLIELPVVATVPQNNAPVATGQTTNFNNNILFYKGVDPDSIADLNNKILIVRNAIEKNCIDLGISSNIPINLYIHSPGGNMLAGFAAADIIEKEYINTHIQGCAGSAASVMSVCGKHRTITKHSFIMIHQLSSLFGGNFNEFKDYQKNIDLFMETLKNVYKQHTKLPKDKLDEILSHDLWWNAETALEYGLVDEIV